MSGKISKTRMWTETSGRENERMLAELILLCDEEEEERNRRGVRRGPYMEVEDDGTPTRSLALHDTMDVRRPLMMNFFDRMRPYRFALVPNRDGEACRVGLLVVASTP